MAASRQQHINAELCCEMEWCRDFTALVLHFARRLADIDVIPLDEAFLNGTPLYPNFQLGTTFDPAQPKWQEYLAGYH